MKTRLRIIVILIVTICFSNRNISAQSSLKDRTLELTATAGTWLNFPASFYYERIEGQIKKNISPLVKLMGDYYLHKNFTLGLYLNYSPYNHPNLTNTNPTNINMFEYGAGFKPVFYLSDKTALKFGLNVGLRKTMSDSENLSGKGLGLNFSLEIQHQLNSFGAITIEPGFLAQPIGFTGPGVKDAGKTMYQYTYAPVFYINVGFTLFGTKN